MIKKIVTLINTHFDEGIILSPDLEEYLYSTCEINSIDDVEKIEPTELDSFYELLFYPDISFQNKIEQIVGMAVLSIDDVDQVIYLTKRDKIKIVLNNEELIIGVDSSLTEKFVKRLRLTNSVINKLAIKNLKNEDAVSIRNSGIKNESRSILFLRDLYDKKDFFTDFESALKLSLKTISEGSGKDLKKVFIEKKLFFATSIQKALQFADLLKKNNIETLMMQGISTPAVDIEESLKSIQLLTAINRVVFNHYNVSDDGHLMNLDFNVTSEVSDILNMFKENI